MIGRLLGIASIGSAVASVTMLHRFLAGITGVIALTIISAFMTGMLLVGVFYGIYDGLTRYGLQPDAAFITVGGLVFLVTVTLASVTVLRLRQLQELPRRGLSRDVPSLSRVGDIVNAFIEGLTARHVNDKS